MPCLTFQTFRKLSRLSGNFIFYKDFQENLITSDLNMIFVGGLERCPPGGLSAWRLVRLEACPPGGLSAWGPVRLEACPAGGMSYWWLVRWRDDCQPLDAIIHQGRRTAFRDKLGEGCLECWFAKTYTTRWPWGPRHISCQR